MPDTTRPEEEHYGRFERGDGQLRLRFTRRLPHPLQQVWRALTASEHLAAWFPTTIEGERAAGAPLRFAHRDGIAPPFEGEMLAFQPPSLMELRWGQDILRFELRPAGDETVLDFTDTFDELGRAARDGRGGTAAWMPSGTRSPASRRRGPPATAGARSATPTSSASAPRRRRSVRPASGSARTTRPAPTRAEGNRHARGRQLPFNAPNTATLTTTTPILTGI